jgi:hypothetical protein
MPTPRPGQFVFANPNSYCTAAGTHGGFPACDSFADRGTPIYAAYSGRVEAYLYGRNNLAYLYPDPGQTPATAFFLAHGNVPFKTGRWRQGEVVGQVGNTGAENTSPHLHWAGATDGNVERGYARGSGNMWFEPWTWGQGTPPAPVPIPTTDRFKTLAPLKLRVAPGTDTVEIETLPAGTLVRATVTPSYSWRKVIAPSGKAGFVADDYLEKI